MTTAVLQIETGRSRQGRGALVWVASLTAIWVMLNYWQPAIQASGVPNAALRLMIHALIGVGLWLGLERTELRFEQRRNTWLAVMIPFTLWAAVIWSAAINGLFRPGAVPAPLLPLAIFVPVLVGAPILLWSKRMGQVVDAMPATWLVALQLYRVFGVVFLVTWARGLLPGVFALPAGTGDFLTGLFALPVAFALAAGTAEGRRWAVAWNVFGLVDFAIAVGMGLITSPGPLQLIVPSVPNIGGGAYPTVMIPAFAVPSSILLHVLSLRQLRRAANRA
jgi:hypothetical protein